MRLTSRPTIALAGTESGRIPDVMTLTWPASAGLDHDLVRPLLPSQNSTPFSSMSDSYLKTKLRPDPPPLLLLTTAGGGTTFKVDGKEGNNGPDTEDGRVFSGKVGPFSSSGFTLT